MQLNLSPDQVEGLTRLAMVNGFPSVEDYALDLLGQYAAAGVTDGAELKRSAQALERAHEQYQGGQARDLSEVVTEIAEKHKLPFRP